MTRVNEKTYINYEEYMASCPLDIKEIHAKYGKGEGVKVMIVDGGLSMHKSIEKEPIYKYNTLNKNIDITDNTGHGTHVASIIIGECGLAPDVEYGFVKAMDVNGGTHASVYDAISVAVQHGYDIISLSLGTYQELSMIVKNKLQDAYARGVTICCAVGNDSKTFATYPAKYSTVIGVGGLGEDEKTIADFSNSEFDILAPSVDIAGAYPDNKYVKMTGTSMATPIVVSLIAIFKSYCKKNNIQLTEKKLKELVSKERVVGKYFLDNIIGKAESGI